MQSFDSITDARNAIMDLPVASVPEPLRDRFRQLRASPSPVEQIVLLGEYLYANRAEVEADARELSGGLIQFATVNAWFGLQVDNRGDRIVQAVRRDLGEDAPSGSSFPDPADDPAPLPQYAAPVTAPPAPVG